MYILENRKVEEDNEYANVKSILVDYYNKVGKKYQSEWFTSDFDRELQKYLSPPSPTYIKDWRRDYFGKAAEILIDKYDMDHHAVENAIKNIL